MKFQAPLRLGWRDQPQNDMHMNFQVDTLFITQDVFRVLNGEVRLPQTLKHLKYTQRGQLIPKLAVRWKSPRSLMFTMKYHMHVLHDLGVEELFLVVGHEQACLSPHVVFRDPVATPEKLLPAIFQLQTDQVAIASLGWEALNKSTMAEIETFKKQVKTDRGTLIAGEFERYLLLCDVC